MLVRALPFAGFLWLPVVQESVIEKSCVLKQGGEYLYSKWIRQISLNSILC